MQIVIDISDEIYNRIKTCLIVPMRMQKEVINAVDKGTPIPQGLEPLIIKLIEDAKEVENG